MRYYAGFSQIGSQITHAWFTCSITCLLHNVANYFKLTINTVFLCRDLKYNRIHHIGERAFSGTYINYL